MAESPPTGGLSAFKARLVPKYRAGLCAARETFFRASCLLTRRAIRFRETFPRLILENVLPMVLAWERPRVCPSRTVEPPRRGQMSVPLLREMVGKVLLAA